MKLYFAGVSVFLAACIGHSNSNPSVNSVCPPVPKDAIRGEKTGQKAWDKCLEVAEYVYPCNNSAGFRHNACAHVSTPLILDGQVYRGEFPHLAQIGHGTQGNTTWFCTGSLISERWVITAAHCLVKNDREGLYTADQVRLDAVTSTKPEDQYGITNRVLHPEFQRLQIYNDIGLAQLDRDVIFSPFVLPACLHTGNVVIGSRLTLTGWAEGTHGGPFDKSPQKIPTRTMEYEDCSKKFPPSRKAKDGLRNATQICARKGFEFKEACTIEGGSPLLLNNEVVYCTHLIIGIHSIGGSCYLSEEPSIYTRVSAFIPWIESVVWPDN